MASRNGGAGRRLGRWTVQVVTWAVLLTALFVIAAAVVVPRIGGGTPYTILTSSMTPRYPPGTLVVVRPEPPEEIGVGTVITYQLRSGEPTVVTHRVVSVAERGDGERTFVTRGDANETDDAEPVTTAQVRGTLWYAVPKVGWVSQAIDGRDRDLAVHAAAGALAVYALWMIVGAVRERRASRREVQR